MAQLEPIKKHAKSPGGGNREITVEYLLQAHDINSPARASPTFGKINHDQDQEDLDQQPKKSVLTKVKEKAKKLKQTLSMKKHNHDEDDNASSPAVDHASLDADEDEEEEEEEEEEDDPEYYGAPMYESELAPEDVKETARQHPREDVEILEKHVLVGKGKETTEEGQVTKEKNNSSSKTITESVTEKLAPAYAMATEATQMITSKIQDMAIATSLALERKGSGGVRGEQKWDKGVSVKEYLMQKLEPGDDERALSQVISEAISPRKDPGDKGVVEKVKGTVSSLFGKEESSSTISPSPLSSPSSLSSVTATEAATTSSSSRPPSNIPISWNAYQGAWVEEEENEGRILQTN